MKIALVAAPTNQPTAREREAADSAEWLAAALAERGHDVVVYTRRVAVDAADEEKLDSGVIVRQVEAGPVRPLSDAESSAALSDFGRALADEWRRRTPEIVHAYSWTSGLAAVSARQQLRETALVGGGASTPPVPVVLTFTGFGAEHRRQGPEDAALTHRIRLEVALVRSVDAVLAGSDAEADELSRMGIPRERLSTVPAGIDVDRFTPSGPAAVPSDDPRVLAVGELEPASGFETTIAAMRGLPGVELTILGGAADDRLGAAEVARLRAGAQQLGVADRVRFADDVADPGFRPALLRSADAVVCVPWHGPAGAGAVLEAMGCGVPVVVTAVGAVADVIVDGVTGVQVAPRRPDQLATALRSLLGDPVRRLGFGVAGADRVRSRYGWARVAETTERVYARLLPEVVEDVVEPDVVESAVVEEALD